MRKIRILLIMSLFLFLSCSKYEYVYKVEIYGRGIYILKTTKPLAPESPDYIILDEVKVKRQHEERE